MTHCNASIKDTTFNASHASQDGGAIRATECNMTLESCSLLRNSAAGNGGAMLANQASIVSLKSCTQSGNTALRFGGAMWTSSNTKVTLTRCSISKSRCDWAGGAIYVSAHDTLVITLSTLWGNKAGTRGGAIYLSPESVATLSETHITDNTAGHTSSYGAGGGLMIAESASATLTSCLLTRNSALAQAGGTGRGGALLSHSRVAIKACLISGNTAMTSGGGVAYSPKKKDTDGAGPQTSGAVSSGLQISGSCLVGNSAAEEGSAVWLQAATYQLAMTLVLEQSAVGPQNGSASWIHVERGLVILDRATLSSQPAALNACLDMSAVDPAGVPVGLHLEKSQALLYHSNIDDKLRTSFDAFSFIVDATIALGEQQARQRIGRSELCVHIEQSMDEYLRSFLSGTHTAAWPCVLERAQGQGLLVPQQISPSSI